MERLDKRHISQFINEGFIKLEKAFPAEIADECREILWKATNYDPGKPHTWKEAVVRIGELSHEPFRIAANTKLLQNSFDQLAGKGNWLPRLTMGSFPIRFPSKQLANDTGWHVDASFPGDDMINYLEWRINIQSKGRALLMLFLFSDVGENDAPTRIRVGSHLDVAKILQPAGQAGLSFLELTEKLHLSTRRREILATGDAGTVFLCHPFIVHAAQPHRGKYPRFMAQPPLLAAREFNIQRSDKNYCPVEEAILTGLAQDQ